MISEFNFYKETRFVESQIGEIPEGWQVKPLGQIIKEVTEKNDRNEKLVVFAITKHAGLVPSLQYFKKRVFSLKLNNYKIIRKNQFAYSPIHLNEGSIGLLETENKGMVSPLHVVFSLSPEADPQFFELLLKSHRLLSIYQRLPNGSIERRGAISFTDFSKILVQFPPLDEQQKIREVISLISVPIRRQDEIVTMTHLFKKSLISEVLSHGLGHKEFKDTEIGKVPTEWQLVPLKELVRSYKNGIYKPNSYAGKGYPCIRMYNISGGQVNAAKATLLDVTEDELREYGLEPGDILVNRVNSPELVGKAGLVPIGFGKATFESKNIRVRLNTQKILPEFFSVYVQTKAYAKQVLSRAKTAVAQATITQNDLDSILVPLSPSIDEQRKIAEMVFAINSQINFEKDEKIKLLDIKQGLASLLITGKIRIKVD